MPCLRQRTLKMIPWLSECPYIGNNMGVPPPPLPLCPSPNIVGFRSLRTKTLCMCVLYAIGGGGGGGQKEEGRLQEHVWSLVSPLGKKRVDFWHKKSRHAKFQQILSNLKNRNEIGTYASLPRSPSIILLTTRRHLMRLRSCVISHNYYWLAGAIDVSPSRYEDTDSLCTVWCTEAHVRDIKC